MSRRGNGDGALSGYRILDLTDDKGMLCSRLLAEHNEDIYRKLGLSEKEIEALVREGVI